MKKYKTKIIMILAVLALLFLTNVTFAWFTATSNSLSPQIDAGVVTKYFDHGTGTENDPFVITRPEHYYHMVEFFQRTTALPLSDEESEVKQALFGDNYLYFQIGDLLDENNHPDTYYVYAYNDDGSYKTTDDGSYLSSESGMHICQSLNMAYYSGDNALMPIGSSEVPFIGSLDGKGIDVKNLNIVSHATVKVKKTDEDEPISVERSTSDMGIFGYVGKSSAIQNVFFSDVNIYLKDVKIAGDGEKNEISEEHDDDLHGTDTKVAYVGYLAGHVYTTTNISNVYLNDCKIIGGTNEGEISVQNGFGAFGYIYDPEAQKPVQSMGQFVTELKKDGSQDWGGSIDMQDIFERLCYFEDKAEKQSTYYTLIVDGKPVESSSASLSFSFVTTMLSGNTDTVTVKTYYSSKEGSYCFTDFTTKKSEYQGGTVYETLYGASSRFMTTVVNTTGETENIEDGFYICDNGSTKNYMCYDVGTNGIVNSTSKSTVWILDNGYLKLRNVINANGTLVADETVRYLNYVQGALTVSETATTKWQKTDDQIYTTDEDGTQHCIFYSSGWSVSSGGSVTYYTITNNGYNMIVGENNALSADKTDSSKFIVENVNSDGTEVYLKTANGQYLYYNEAFTTIWGLQFSISSTPSKFYINSQKYLYIKTSYSSLSSKSYFLYYSSKWRVYETTLPKANYQTTLNKVDSVSYNAYGESAGEISVSLAKIEKKKNGANTYLPIRVILDDEDESYSGEDKYYVSQKNTGYIIAGANIENATSLANNDAEKAYGDIRVSKFSISNIGNSYSNGSFTTIYTVNSSDSTEYTANSKAYQEASGNLGTTLSGSNYVYGLHFMDSQISMNHIITVNDVTIKNTTYAEYQFPEDCIDFKVAKKGTINFFAGTYFSSNNAFFSLHVIKRDGSKIKSIREISKIYSKKGEYFYYYADEDEDPYGKEDSGYTLEFDCSWITNPSALSKDCLYYFEIPVSVGEYALGSVTGKNGAYLVYLDIAASNDGTTETLIGTKDQNALSKTFEGVDYRTQEQLSEDSFKSEGSLLQFYVVTPKFVSDDDYFTVRAVFEKVSDNDDYDGIYKIFVNTSEEIEFYVCMFDDDDDANNEHRYRYQIYCGDEETNAYADIYYRSANKFIVTSTSVTIETLASDS